MRRFLSLAFVVYCVTLAGAGNASPDASEPASDPEPISPDQICRTIEQSAAENALPVAFFTRLIWQESRFNPRAKSRAGAQGIAQFMPGTAVWRGLPDPYHPLEALKQSALWLSELARQFGNLGLAAAAYNAGPGRVSNWLAKKGGLPGETRNYVRIITGRSAEEWAAPEPPEFDVAAIPKGVPCTQLANLFVPKKAERPGPERRPVWSPWGVQLAGDWSEREALADFRVLQRKFSAVLSDREPVVVRVPFGRRASRHLVRVGEDSRQGAESLCSKLRAAGGACLVLKNPSSATYTN